MNIIEEQDLLFIQERGNRQNCHFLLYAIKLAEKNTEPWLFLQIPHIL